MKTVCSIPNFLRGLQSKSIELLIPYAFAQFLTAAHVPITITGDTSTWNKAGKGALFIGDHRNGLEYFLLLATMGYVGRDDIKVIAKPYSFSVRLTEALDVHHGEYALAVIPNTLASDSMNFTQALTLLLTLNGYTGTRGTMVCSSRESKPHVQDTK